MLPDVNVVVYVNLVGSLFRPCIVSQFLIASSTWGRSHPFCRLGGAAPIYTSGVRNVGMRINLIGNFRSTIHSVKVSSLAPPLFHN